MLKIKTIILSLVWLFLFGHGDQVYAESWNFAVFGDTRTNSTSSGDPTGVNTAAVSAINTDIVNKRDCEFLLFVGDLVLGESGTAPPTLNEQFQSFKDTMNSSGTKLVGASGDGLVYYPVRGNHDKTNTKYGTDVVAAWEGKFDTLPGNGPTTAAGGGGNSEVGFTYSFTSNNALIIGVDQYLNSATLKVNQNWVNEQLGASTSQHVFAFGHEPAYQASHSDCLAQNKTARDNFLTSLYNAGGKIYFAGHDHVTAVGRVYEKSPASGGTQQFYQIIVGGGGAPKTNFNGTYNKNYPTDYAVVDLYHDSDSSAGIPFHYAYAVVTVDGSMIWVRIYGTESLSSVDWQPLHSLVIGDTLLTNTTAVSGNMTIDSTLTLNQDFDGSYSGVISGLGNFTKSGSGMVTLSGNNTYNGTTTVNAGTLLITGDSSNTDVTVNAVGIFGGTGTVKSLTNHGIVRPGTSIGTLNLGGGSYVQSADATLEIEVASTSSFDKIIGASASLGGKLKTITSGDYVAADTLIGVIQTSGGISGNFTLLDTPITPTMVWQPSINGNNLDLVATRDYNNAPLRGALTTNQQNIAEIMQEVLPSATGDLAAIKSAIDGLATNTTVAAAYSEVLPEKLNALPDFTLSNGMAGLKTLQQTMQSWHSEMGANLARKDFSVAPVLLAYAGNDAAKFIPQKNAAEEKANQKMIFVRGEGSFGDQEATANQPGFSYSAGGFIAGMGYRLNQNFALGFYSGYLRTDAELGGAGGNVAVDTLSYGGMSSYYKDNFYIDASLGMALNFYDTERAIVFANIDRKAKGETLGKQLNVLLAIGYDFYLDKLITGPFADLRYSRLWIEGFSETGADALNMDIENQTAQSLQLGLGWQLQRECKKGRYKLTPKIFASYQHEFYSGGRSVKAKLAQGGSAFEVSTDKPAKDFAILGAGLQLQITQNSRINLNYKTHLGEDNYAVHDIDGSVQILF